MKIVEFKYTDSKGKISDRVVLELYSPKPEDLLCVDLSDATAEEMDNLLVDVKEVLSKESSEEELKALMDVAVHKHNMHHQYRRFKVANMTEVTITNLKD